MDTDTKLMFHPLPFTLTFCLLYAYTTCVQNSCQEAAAHTCMVTQVASRIMEWNGNSTERPPLGDGIGTQTQHKLNTHRQTVQQEQYGNFSMSAIVHGEKVSNLKFRSHLLAEFVSHSMCVVNRWTHTISLE